MESIFRAGEVVWYLLPTSTWRLGLLVQSQVSNEKTAWVVRQFAYNYANVAIDDQIMSEDSIRPFLAFSVPRVDESVVPGVRGQDMTAVVWHEFQEQHDDEVLKRKIMLEASKIGAANIDHSFSTFNRLPIDDPVKDMYNGAFIGCERVQLDDAVRIRVNEGTALQGPDGGGLMPVVMSIREIYNSKTDESSLCFTGSIWRMEATYQPPQSQNHDLPVDLADEMNFRNRVSSRNGIWYQWAMLEENATMERSQVLGRFYPTRKLMPLAKPTEHAADIQQGKITELHVLNNMGNSESIDLGRMTNRWETVLRVMVDPDARPLNFGPSVEEDIPENLAYLYGITQ